MEDKRIEELKDMMYKTVRNCDYKLQVEAVKAYAMLCMAQQGSNLSEVVATPNNSGNTKTGWSIEIQEG